MYTKVSSSNFLLRKHHCVFSILTFYQASLCYGESNREEEKIIRMMIPTKKLDNKSNNYLGKSECYLWYLIMYTFITL